MHQRIYATVVIAIICVSALVAGQAASKKTLPPAIKAVFESAYPHATITHWATEKEPDGSTVVEVESMDGKQRRDLLYSVSGDLLESEELMTVADLPSEVAAAVKHQFPKAVVTRAEKLTKKGVVQYELALKGAKVKEAVFDPTGHLVDKP